jgi:hypothetical protein
MAGRRIHAAAFREDPSARQLIEGDGPGCDLRRRRNQIPHLTTARHGLQIAVASRASIVGDYIVTCMIACLHPF